MSRALLVLPLLLFLGLAGWFALGLTRDPSVLPSNMIDKPAPAFDLPPIADSLPGLKSSDLKGQAQLVNIFASWCAPCRVEHPVLMRLAGELKVPLVGIAYKDKPEATRAFLDQLGNPFTAVGQDRDGRVGIDFGVYGVPETYVVDREGRIRYRHVGPLMPADVEEKILPLMRELSK
ncbi:DsbE family thiol:disulfide interchange protein [Aerophototrophica crusticola]|uniref:DsbE family thiol:disulfide interchange protein n=1 Tax=Aerophototrophica crusticola TaxID=1709002 RepID=A0A858RB18_9PROT|nr:DsbE family thiol:disulfide interchange protein [Rhodospirillaceae bacterium B3]